MGLVKAAKPKAHWQVTKRQTGHEPYALNLMAFIRFSTSGAEKT